MPKPATLTKLTFYSPTTLYNAEKNWVGEVRHFCKHVPIVLVGNKTDLRTDPKVIEELGERQEKPVTPEQGKHVANKINASAYVECSAKLKEGVDDVFLAAADAAMINRKTGHFASHVKGKCVLQ